MQTKIDRRLARLNGGVQRGTVDLREARTALAEMTPGGMKALRRIEDRVESAMATPTSRDEDTFIVGGRKVDITKTLAGRDSLPKYVVAEGGAVYDLDTGEAVQLEDTVEIDGRILKVGAFGSDGFATLYELFEMFLFAHENVEESVFRPDDGSSSIIEFMHNDEAKKMLRTRFGVDGLLEQYIDWGIEIVTFELWLAWAIAQMRWMIKARLEQRFREEMDIRSRGTMVQVRDVLDLTIIAAEKYLALPERQRLSVL